jgi:DMSO/TMAO reductase YedYZ molybdopterin-dependent catalytic subunit
MTTTMVIDATGGGAGRPAERGHDACMTSPLSRIGARGRAAALPPGRLPPGQYVPRGWPVLHYGPVPRTDLARWDLRVFGETASGEVSRWDWAAFGELPRTEVVADFHCVTKFSTFDNRWGGVAVSTLLELAPPAAGATHALAWAEYGYSANLSLEDLAQGVLATHWDGEPLTVEHGWPLRLVVPHRYAWKGPKWLRGIEYLDADRRGFWEERGYHNRADPWREERWSYQEEPGDGPPL